MNDKVKQENRKALPKFFLIIIAAGIVGGIVGFFAGLAGAANLSQALTEWANRAWRTLTPWGIPVTSVLLLGSAFFQYHGAKQTYASWDGEDEAVVEDAELRLSWTLLLTSVAMILNFLFLAAGTLYLKTWEMSLVNVGTFLLSVIAIMVIQQRVVDLEKTMNPEKCGSVYDSKFQKKWFQSCDEAEQHQIGQAAYRAFMMGSQTCTWLWLALVILNFVFDFGMMPIVATLLIWGVLQVSYTLESIRLSKGKR